MSKKGMLFVLGEDRPGIVKAVTGILYQAGANLEDVSMTLLDGQFAMMLSFQISKLKWPQLEKQTGALSRKPWNLNVDMVSISKQRKSKIFAGRSLLITAIGKDRTGIVHTLSSGLAKIQANITNLDCRLLQRIKTNPLYSLALEVDLKYAGDIKKIEKLVKVWQSKLRIEVKVNLSESAVF